MRIGDRTKNHPRAGQCQGWRPGWVRKRGERAVRSVMATRGQMSEATVASLAGLRIGETYAGLAPVSQRRDAVVGAGWPESRRRGAVVSLIALMAPPMIGIMAPRAGANPPPAREGLSPKDRRQTPSRIREGGTRAGVTVCGDVTPALTAYTATTSLSKKRA